MCAGGGGGGARGGGGVEVNLNLHILRRINPILVYNFIQLLNNLFEVG